MTKCERIKLHKKQVPEQYKTVYDKAVKGNRVSGIKAFCLECVCWEREEVRLCTSPECPLYAVRPYLTPEEVKAKKRPRTAAQKITDKANGERLRASRGVSKAVTKT